MQQLDVPSVSVSDAVHGPNTILLIDSVRPLTHLAGWWVEMQYYARDY